MKQNDCSATPYAGCAVANASRSACALAIVQSSARRAGTARAFRYRSFVGGLVVYLLFTFAAPTVSHAHTPTYDEPPKILVLRGLCEVFSLGMNDLKAKLAACGYDVKVTSWSLALLEFECSQDQPIVIIGHSLGGRMCAWVSRKVMKCGRRVPLIIIVDANLLQPIPGNVDKCLNLYVTNPLGVFHGSPVRAESPATEIVNWDVSKGQPACIQGGVNHFDIDSTSWVHEIIINEIARTFPKPVRKNAQINSMPCADKPALGWSTTRCPNCTRDCLGSCGRSAGAKAFRK